jgi:hypothetical protein
MDRHELVHAAFVLRARSPHQGAVNKLRSAGPRPGVNDSLVASGRAGWQFRDLAALSTSDSAGRSPSEATHEKHAAVDPTTIMPMVAGEGRAITSDIFAATVEATLGSVLSAEGFAAAGNSPFELRFHRDRVLVTVRWDGPRLGELSILIGAEDSKEPPLELLDIFASISAWDGTVTQSSRPVDFTPADCSRSPDGLAAEHWDTVDYVRLYQAFGLLPDDINDV